MKAGLGGGGEGNAWANRGFANPGIKAAALASSSSSTGNGEHGGGESDSLVEEEDAWAELEARIRSGEAAA